MKQRKTKDDAPRDDEMILMRAPFDCPSVGVSTPAGPRLYVPDDAGVFHIDAVAVEALTAAGFMRE